MPGCMRRGDGPDMEGWRVEGIVVVVDCSDVVVGGGGVGDSERVRLTC